MVHASSWDFLSEYGHPTQSPPWSYGWSPNGDLHFFGLLNVANIDGGHAAWWKDTAGNPPVMWRNDNATIDYGIQPGEVSLHTSWTNLDMIKVRWTAPSGIAEYVDYYGRLGTGDGGEREIWVVKNAGQASEEVLFHAGPASGDFPFFKVIAVREGDTLDFVQGAGIVMNSENSPLYLYISELVETTDPVECILQLDAAHGLKDPNTGIPYVDGDIVKLWQDTQSGKAMKANLAWGEPTLETTEINGLPVIRFTGEDGLVIDPNSDPADLLNTPNFTMYIVGRINDLSLSRIFYANYSDPAAGSGVGVSDSEFNKVKFYSNYYDHVLVSDEELVEGRFYLITVSKDWMDNTSLYINGELIDSGLGKVTYNANTIASIGALDIGRQFLKGDIAEIRIYNGVDTAEQAVVTSSLISKYDIDTSPVVPDLDTITITGITFWRCSNSGATFNTEQWNTFYLDAAWDIAIYEGDTITEPNTLKSVSFNNRDYMMIDIPLQAGQERTFTWHNAHTATGPDPGYYGATLFFDGGQKQNNMGITVFAEMDTTGPGDGNPVFQPDSNYAGGWPYSTPKIGPGLVYLDPVKQMKISMTDYVVYDADLGIDVMPSQYNNEYPLGGGDGYKDMFGHFTLKVEKNLTCETHFTTDVNHDCYVNLVDLAVLADTWLTCYDPEGCH